MATGRCLVCGVEHASCGTPFASTPVDIPQVRTRSVGPTRRYTVTVGKHTTVMKLNAEDAKQFGDDAVPVDGKPAAKTRGAQNKVRTVSDKGSTDGPAGNNG